MALTLHFHLKRRRGVAVNLVKGVFVITNEILPQRKHQSKFELNSINS